MSLSFPPMNNSQSVSSDSNAFDSNITSTIEVSSASFTVNIPTISASNNLDEDRAVIPTTESEDRLKRIEDAIARLGSAFERFINNSSSIKRGDIRGSREFQTQGIFVHVY